MDSPPHHSGHVHPERDVPVHSESSRRCVTSACRRFPLSQPCPPACDCCATPDMTMLQFTRTHLPREVAGTFFWQPGAWDPSARRATGLVGACAGCWWVGSCELGCFQLRQQMGAKNAKKEESESLREQKMMRAQRATLIQVGSCRVTNALPLLLAQALDFLLQEALALPLLGVLGALLPVQLKTPHFASSYPPAAGARSGQPRISPYRWIPCPGPPDPGAASLHRPASPAARHYVRPKRADRRDRGGQTGLPEGEVPRSTSSRCPIPTPLHQPALHYLSEGPIGSTDLRKDVQQLKLPVEVRGVGQLDDLLCSSGGSCRAHPPKTRTTR